MEKRYKYYANVEHMYKRCEKIKPIVKIVELKIKNKPTDEQCGVNIQLDT